MEAKSAPHSRGDGMDQVLELVRQVAKESGGRPRTARPRPGDRLDQDLGIDSLARAELVMRCEREFHVSLPESAVQAETPEQLLDAVIKAGATPRRQPQQRPQYSPVKQAGGSPEEAQTLLEAFDWHVQQHPERPHLYIYGDEEEPEPLTYGDLDRRAAEVTGGLHERGIGTGDTVALMLPTGRDYFVSFIGILLAGAVPVPIYPPARPAQLEEHLRRHGRILTNAQTRLLVTVPEARRLAQLLKAEAPELEGIITADELAQPTGGRPGMDRRADDLALLQYTSGSTGDPKGISLAHTHLLANIRAIGRRVDASSEDVFVSWLPLYHDMGLIGAWFGSLYFGCPLAVMSPLAFLAHPLRWLWTIHRHRATLSASPNFGYELCLRAARDSEDLKELDLSSWRIAFNGAEPVSPRTLERFHAKFRGNGLRWESLMPVYGLAEVAVGLTISRPDRGPWVDAVDREVFTRSGDARPAAEDTVSSLRFPSSGPPLDGYEVRVVDNSDRELPERRQGNIQFRGPSTTPGYYRSPRLTEDLFHGSWLDSGDLGYLAKGELFVTGRVKDMIVRSGRNIYPHEVEQAVGEVEGVRKGCVAVFGSPEAESGIERLVIVAETHEQESGRRQAMARQITERATHIAGIPPDDVRLSPPHSVLKTSSGKIRRGATRELYETDRLGESGRSVWWQVTRLGASAAASRLGQRLEGVKERLYAGYAWGVFGLIAPPAWLAVALLPRRRWRWAVSRSALRTAAALLGLSIEVAGLENLPRNRHAVFVANHASYIDPLVLTAVLPADARFLAKRELGSHFFTRVLLERLGTLMVERFDLQRARQEAERAEQILRGGDSLAFFPEGTFTRASGVRQFRLGAFQVAARTRTPVVPVALSGTRSVLRGTEWFPRRLPLRVQVGPPVEPRADDWPEIVRLRDEARAFIVAESGEPDLMEG